MYASDAIIMFALMPLLSIPVGFFIRIVRSIGSFV